MSTMQFTPDKIDNTTPPAPYFEDARAEFAPGYATTKGVDALQGEIQQVIALLGGGRATFRSGTFGAGKTKRYGYEVEFRLDGRPSSIQVAALPLRSETPKKKQQALAHALYNVRDWLRGMHTSQVFAPGYAPLVQFVLVPGTGKTVGEMLLIHHEMPNMNPSLPVEVQS